MKIQNCLLLTLAVILIASCNKNDEPANNDSIIFSYHSGGSWIGLDENLIINSGATHYSVSYRDLQTGKSKSYQTKMKTSGKQWQYLMENFDLKTFTKIQDGSCRACLDGFDDVFSVTLDRNTYSIYNGNNDEHYKQMQNFFDAIDEQIGNFETLAGFR